MKNVELVINKQLYRFGFWPLILTIIFMIITVIIIAILIHEELNRKDDKK